MCLVAVRVTAGKRSTSDGSDEDLNEGTTFRGVSEVKGSDQES